MTARCFIVKRGGEFPCFQNSAPVQEGDGLLKKFTGEFHCKAKILQTVDKSRSWLWLTGVAAVPSLMYRLQISCTGSQCCCSNCSSECPITRRDKQL